MQCCITTLLQACAWVAVLQASSRVKCSAAAMLLTFETAASSCLQPLLCSLRSFCKT